MVTAIFGGTFNPFHIGHYEMLSSLNNLPFVDRVLLLPDKIPPHKECDFLASDTDRIEMCRIVGEKFTKTELCLIEFERTGKSYTFDTLTELKKLYKDDSFLLVCGADMVTSFKAWYKWEDILKLCGLLCFDRKGEKGFLKAIEDLRRLGADITVLNDSITDVSSTELRKAIKTEKAQKLIPKEVYSFIIEKGLYLE